MVAPEEEGGSGYQAPIRFSFGRKYSGGRLRRSRGAEPPLAHGYSSEDAVQEPRGLVAAAIA
jgi:hypothetical protein